MIQHDMILISGSASEINMTQHLTKMLNSTQQKPNQKQIHQDLTILFSLLKIHFYK